MTLLEKAAESGKSALIVAPNWAEIRYQVGRKVGEKRWEEVREKLLGLPIEIVPADQRLAEGAGAIKAHRKMSLADCFAAALAADRQGRPLHRRSRVPRSSGRHQGCLDLGQPTDDAQIKSS